MSPRPDIETAFARVMVVGRIHEAGLSILRARKGLEIEEITGADAQIPREGLAQCDALLIRTGTMTEDDVALAGRLRVVARHGVGCDNLPLNALTRRGIPVVIVGPVNAISVAEQAMTMMLALSKRIWDHDSAVRTGDWSYRNSLASAEFFGKTLLLLGLGRIGKEVARRACAFGLKVLVHDPFVSAGAVSELGAVKVDDWRAVLDRVDFLSLHLPLNADTRNIVGADVLARIRPDAKIINVARGGLVDEQALYQALSDRMRTGGAGLDTFEHEPPRPDTPLFGLSNVMLSPHSAAMTAEAARRMAEVAARNIVAGLSGTLDPELVVNREVLNIPDTAGSVA